VEQLSADSLNLPRRSRNVEFHGPLPFSHYPTPIHRSSFSIHNLFQPRLAQGGEKVI
jgi:hypothetical protein